MSVVAVSLPQLVPVSLPSLTILVLTAPSCECVGGFLHPKVELTNIGWGQVTM